MTNRDNRGDAALASSERGLTVDGGNGSPIYVRANGKPIFDANGEFRGYHGISSDATALMSAQEALRESERRSCSVIDGIAGLIAIMGPNGEIETVNRQALERPWAWKRRPINYERCCTDRLNSQPLSGPSRCHGRRASLSC